MRTCARPPCSDSFKAACMAAVSSVVPSPAAPKSFTLQKGSVSASSVCSLPYSLSLSLYTASDTDCADAAVSERKMPLPAAIATPVMPKAASSLLLLIVRPGFCRSVIKYSSSYGHFFSAVLGGVQSFSVTTSIVLPSEWSKMLPCSPVEYTFAPFFSSRSFKFGL
ncbi:MAG: hypothetical protein K0R28_6658 [Paenibacillus sp.]|nr:hypothetical protein [Paenibacillus sp.]